MEFLSLTGCLSSLPPIQNHPKSHKTISVLRRGPLQSYLPISKTTSEASLSHQNCFPSIQNTDILHSPTIPELKSCLPHSSFPEDHLLIRQTELGVEIMITHLLNRLDNRCSVHKAVSFLQNSLKLQLPFAFMVVSAPFPCIATETSISAEQVSNKINLESVLISIDDFFNRNPFFVAGVTFIWLVVIPLAQEYLRKFKFISAINAFRKLRDDPSSQLLDIREKQSLLNLGSPNLNILNKRVVQVQFSEGEEKVFVRKLLENFKDAGNTTVCIIDDFDGNSMKVAELLVKNGFKEAYAIKGGIKGKNGWQEIQETLLPLSVHVLPNKVGKTSQKLEIKGRVNRQTEEKSQVPSFTSASEGSERTKVERTKSKELNSQANHGSNRALSPYPNAQVDCYMDHSKK
ncbi:PREDICTED: rhodanese-like domain-containing protein 4A, chloroplastic isoform X2 [Nelumbo nucifera]|uniref:Rhodanese-like domain-containing protein 4A, chloroplastic isoform X2 n=1 Tax=Nelumbo nucifera TaxID=4432 RepID=A0A1U8Q1S2_NELNU|nr:PREDICTED: rhodanese-like domain-containing protein 4A, chloroplastic isoform X2 [Nelumbo nucifera]